jgi:hypothetical protein
LKTHAVPYGTFTAVHISPRNKQAVRKAKKQ